MIYGLIDRNNYKSYTYLSNVFRSINGEQNKYNWLIADVECYPKNKDFDKLFQAEYCWLSGDELTAVIEQEDFQWIWGVLCGFEKDVMLEEVLKHPLPSAQNNNGYYHNPVVFQHPLSSMEIVPSDSSWTLLICKDKDVITNYVNKNPNAEDLSEYNKK